MLLFPSSSRLLFYKNRICLCRCAFFLSSSPIRTPYVPLSASYSSYGKTESLVLDNGHTLSYSICGSTEPSAIPVLFFHGFPCSRLELVGSWAAQFNIRLITPDRPGLGFPKTGFSGKFFSTNLIQVSHRREGIRVADLDWG